MRLSKRVRMFGKAIPLRRKGITGAAALRIADEIEDLEETIGDLLETQDQLLDRINQLTLDKNALLDTVFRLRSDKASR